MLATWQEFDADAGSPPQSAHDLADAFGHLPGD